MTYLSEKFSDLVVHLSNVFTTFHVMVYGLNIGIAEPPCTTHIAHWNTLHIESQYSWSLHAKNNEKVYTQVQHRYTGTLIVH